ncbi:hypothetical protein K449DRAFT_463468 [Hypoxylon sp. EC38]|nr:hypothetical protein K449DRAFT_463468 [Hypoxylon sp. EC38]
MRCSVLAPSNSPVISAAPSFFQQCDNALPCLFASVPNKAQLLYAKWSRTEILAGTLTGWCGLEPGTVYRRADDTVVLLSEHQTSALFQMFVVTTAIVVVAILCDAVSASNFPIYPPLTGHDFDFTATYPSGLKISTSDPPKDVLPATEFPYRVPVVTLTDLDNVGRDDRYISFLEISYIPDPRYDPLNDVIYTFPWAKTNLTVTENGTLSDESKESHRIYHSDAIETSEVRNATLHVWKQTPALMDFISGKDSENMPILWQLILTWSNTTDKVDKNFPRANVDFKVRNETGEYRGGVDDNGASISGYVATSTSSTTANPTSMTSTPTGSGSLPVSVTTSTGGPTETPNAASPQVTSASWAMTISGVLLLASAISAV